MKITQDHMDFVAECIANGVDDGEDAVRVDVLAIGERFGVTWKVARRLLQDCAKQLGHRMVGPNSSKVTKSKRVASPKESHLDTMLAATADLVARYSGENASLAPES